VVAGVRLVVGLRAVDDPRAVGRLAVQELEAAAVLRALLLVWARGELHVDRGAGDVVLVEVVIHRKVVGNLLLNENGRSLNGDPPTLVAVIEGIYTVFGQPPGEHRGDAQA